MTKPNLFIVGAPKCGTTAWYRYLGAHPDIFFPEEKEPHYFALDLPGFRRITSEPDYLDMFSEAGDATIAGEASVFYMCSNVAAEQIHRFNPQAKVLIFLRDQEHCIPSLHQQLLFTFADTMQDFADAWRQSGRRPKDSIPSTNQDEKILDYKAMGRFREQVARFARLFPRENIRIIRFDDWVNDPRSTYVEILDFLGVSDDGRMEFPRVNEARFHQLRGLGRFLQHPPAWVEIPKRQVKKLLGVKTLGIADAIASVNLKKGYTDKPSDQLRQEMRSYYAGEGQTIEDAAAVIA